MTADPVFIHEKKAECGVYIKYRIKHSSFVAVLTHCSRQLISLLGPGHVLLLRCLVRYACSYTYI